MKPATRRLSSFFALEERRGKGALWPLFLVSFSALYIEILLIRWIGTEVRIFAYFQNLALIACFLGFGLGCYQATQKKIDLFDPVALVILVILVHLPVPGWKRVLEGLSSAMALSPDSAIWALTNSASGTSLLWSFLVSAVMVSGLLLLLIATMLPLGKWVGFYLDAAERPVRAYSVNLLGSLAGIWCFAGMAYLRLPPEYWFGLAFLLFLLLRPPKQQVGVFILVLLGISLLLLYRGQVGGNETMWSPYQKLEVQDEGEHQYTVLVNNTGYMTIANMTPQFVERHPEIHSGELMRSSYDAPFRFAKRLDRVLIVGAGAGNDAAAALRAGAGQIDAVEIDPMIYSLGARLHPEHPYSSPRVRMFVTDARAFLRNSQGRYDVIVFGLLDSHTQFSGYSNMRIDNYVYTKESFREAKLHLKPDGILVLKFEVRAPWTWMGERFYAILEDLFNRPPIVFHSPQLAGLLSATVFIISEDPALWARATRPDLAEMISRNPPPFALQSSDRVPPTTDDWPYVYHRGHSVPRTYLTVSAILLLLAALLVRRGLDPGDSSTWNFFFLGAGFLLLETQLVSRLALYFGATWLVNCIALSAILLVLVLANFWVERRRTRHLRPSYIALVFCLIGIYVLPWQRSPLGTHATGFLLSAAYCLPLFFAGVIFSETFRKCKRKSNAFGSNIVGAVAGGLVQNVSFLFGLKFLLLIASAFYLLAAFFGALRSGAAARAGVPEAAFDRL